MMISKNRLSVRDKRPADRYNYSGLLFPDFMTIGYDKTADMLVNVRRNDRGIQSVPHHGKSSFPKNLRRLYYERNTGVKTFFTQSHYRLSQLPVKLHGAADFVLRRMAFGNAAH